VRPGALAAAIVAVLVVSGIRPYDRLTWVLEVMPIVIALPFIPIFEEAFAFFLAVGGFVYPDIRRLLTDWRYARELNTIIADAQTFQARLASGYVTPEVLEDVLRIPE